MSTANVIVLLVSMFIFGFSAGRVAGLQRGKSGEDTP
jgi:hypothetical protein